MVVLALLSGGFSDAREASSDPKADPAANDVVDLLVSVVDGNGQPVRDLKAEDFEIVEDGEPVSVSLCSKLDGSAVAGMAAEGDATSLAPNRMVLVFDRVSLEKKARKRILKGLEDFLKVEVPSDTRVMVVLVGGGIDVVQPFTLDRGKVAAALEAVEAAEYTGDVLRGKKQVLFRTMNNAHTVQNGAFKPSSPNNSNGGLLPPGSLELDDGLGTMQADQYLDQVNGLRDYEFNRILASLMDLETVVRGVAGHPGRLDVLWFGEDLFIKPGIDAYGTFFDVFQRYRRKVNIEQPEVWAGKKELSKQFEAVGRLCQGMAASIHILDASDRNRYLQKDTMNHSSTTGLSYYAPGDNRSFTFSQEGARAQALTEGGRYLARETGGADLSGSRDVEVFFREVAGIIDSSYRIGFRAENGLDGRLHGVAVGVDGKGRRVYAPSQVPAETVYHRLADLANAEMLLPNGEDQIGFSVSPGPEEAQPDGTIIRAFRVILPTDRVVFVDSDGKETAKLAVAVVMKGVDGRVEPPAVFRLPVAVPVESYKEGAKVASSFRLKVGNELERVVVAIRDELSGKTGCQTLALAGG